MKRHTVAKLPLIALASTFAFASAANAANNYFGIKVNNTCYAGTSCPAIPLPYNTSTTLPVTFDLRMPNGDKYLINGSSWGSNNSNGGYIPGGATFQVTYEGNKAGTSSRKDTITVDWYLAFESEYGSCNCGEGLAGAFSPTIAASSSAGECVNGAACLGPVTPPGDFSKSTTYSIGNTNGAFYIDSEFTIVFGAGSPAGSYIVFGQDTPLLAPTITSFSPKSGKVGSLVTIQGSNFTPSPVSYVTFNDVPSDFTVDSGTSITATVPAGALDGPIRIATSGGVATSKASFKATPSSAGTVTINATDEIPGAGYTSVTTTDGTGTLPMAIPLPAGATSVSFDITGGTQASSCASPCITANGGANYNDADGVGSSPQTESTSISADGAISGIEASVAGFLTGVFENGEPPSGAPPPTLDFTTIGTDFTSLSPLVNQLFFVGDGLTSIGQTQYFDVPAGATVVYLGIPDSCNNGMPGCYGDNSGYFVVNYTVYTASAQPKVSYFSPASGSAGDAVTITGTNLQGATAVTFNGVAASFTQDSSTQITATVPTGATTGPIEITTPVGKATSKAQLYHHVAN